MGSARIRRYAALTGTALLALGLVAIAVLFARPASTPAILGPDGHVLPGGIATLQKVHLGGTHQWVLIRGRSTRNPVLLALHGGPGMPELGVWRFLGDLKSLENDFIVVNWDQRGAGKSYRAIDPTSHMTVNQFVSDATQLTNYLRQRFHQQRIYVVGTSWGTTLGTLLVQRHPELFASYIRTGQMVSQTAMDQIMWRDTIAWAGRTGRSDLAKELRSNGPPPYTTDVVKKMAPLTIYADDVHPYPESAAAKSLTLNASYFPREYTILDGLNTVKGFADTVAVFYSQLRDINFLDAIPRLAVPTYVLEGRYENPARALLARQWFNQLEAPLKHYVVFAHSDHGVKSGDPDAFARYLVDTVLPQTRARLTGH
jgi:proline iminopeptidase